MFRMEPQCVSETDLKGRLQYADLFRPGLPRPMRAFIAGVTVFLILFAVITVAIFVARAKLTTMTGNYREIDRVTASLAVLDLKLSELASRASSRDTTAVALYRETLPKWYVTFGELKLLLANDSESRKVLDEVFTANNELVKSESKAIAKGQNPFGGVGYNSEKMRYSRALAAVHDLQSSKLEEVFRYRETAFFGTVGAMFLVLITSPIVVILWMRYFARWRSAMYDVLADLSKQKHDLEHAHLELKETYDKTLEGWVAALDLRDKETEGHTQRVTEMTLHLAGRFGITGEALEDVRRGALLHDVGKIGIPDRILLKPGRLDDDERREMELHPVYAYQWLHGIEYLRRALDIPYGHHEKWDGTGYPLGLKGEDIPLAARFFAVVDVWDALSSDRPYRTAWDPERVRQHIRDSSGSHFDPKVVEVFMEIMDTMVAGSNGSHVKNRPMSARTTDISS